MGHEQEILLLLGKIDGRMDGFVTAQATARDRADDQEDRIRKLEAVKNKQRGAFIGVTTAASVAASVITFVLSHLPTLGK